MIKKIAREETKKLALESMKGLKLPEKAIYCFELRGVLCVTEYNAGLKKGVTDPENTDSKILTKIWKAKEEEPKGKYDESMQMSMECIGEGIADIYTINFTDRNFSEYGSGRYDVDEMDESLFTKVL